MGKQGILYWVFWLYGLAWKAVLPWLKKNSRLQRGFPQRTTAHYLTHADIWIQAASAGESYLACALVQALMPYRPLTVRVTTTTIQGMDILKKNLSSPNIHPQVTVAFSFFPFDIPSLMDQVVSKISPGVMVLLETELWPGLLSSLKKAQIPTIMVNARLSQKSISRYQKFSWLWRVLAPDIILATSQEDARRFGRIFPHTPIRTMPNIKFDLVIPRSTGPAPCSAPPLPCHPFPQGVPVTLLASIRMEEEADVAMILHHILLRHPQQVVALFPRHMHRIPFWQQSLSDLGHPWQLRSTLTIPISPGTILLWDTFGELKSAFGHATAAFVGGSLKPLGGQNFLEPVMSGVATVTGPHLDNFSWVGEGLFTAGVVTRARNRNEVIHHLCRILERPPLRHHIATTGLGYIRRFQGGTAMAVNTIITTLQSSERS